MCLVCECDRPRGTDVCSNCANWNQYAPGNVFAGLLHASSASTKPENRKPVVSETDSVQLPSDDLCAANRTGPKRAHRQRRTPKKLAKRSHHPEHIFLPPSASSSNLHPAPEDRGRKSNACKRFAAHNQLAHSPITREAQICQLENGTINNTAISTCCCLCASTLFVFGLTRGSGTSRQRTVNRWLPLPAQRSESCSHFRHLSSPSCTGEWGREGRLFPFGRFLRFHDSFCRKGSGDRLDRLLKKI